MTIFSCWSYFSVYERCCRSNIVLNAVISLWILTLNEIYQFHFEETKKIEWFENFEIFEFAIRKHTSILARQTSIWNIKISFLLNGIDGFYIMLKSMVKLPHLERYLSDSSAHKPKNMIKRRKWPFLRFLKLCIFFYYFI